MCCGWRGTSRCAATRWRVVKRCGVFLPTRFGPKGNAIDAGGMSCTDLACPHCRLPIARALLEAGQLYFSLVGVPASGKSYLTAAMSWRLRELLPARFGLGFQDVDPVGNAVLIANEQTLFLRDKPREPVSLEKTQMQGAHYEPVRFGGQTVSLARPFQFLISAKEAGDASPVHHGSLPRVINFYDNAGEHFLPGNDTALTPGTQHVARANALLFLFDPLQDPRCRSRLAGQTDDPQLAEDFAGGARQDTVLNEMGQRIRRYAQLDATTALEQPLIVLVSKADAWLAAAGLSWGDEPEPVLVDAAGNGAVDTELIEKVSASVRAWLSSVTPEFVALAEGLHRTVRYLPVSALGGAAAAQRRARATGGASRPDRAALGGGADVVRAEQVGPGSVARRGGSTESGGLTDGLGTGVHLVCGRTRAGIAGVLHGRGEPRAAGIVGVSA